MKYIERLLPAALAAALICTMSGQCASAVLTGDLNGDSLIDPADAALLLAEYSRLAVGEKCSFADAEKSAADVNGDGLTDSSDASAILTYYAYTSTGGGMSLPEYTARLTSDKVVRADVIEDNDYTLSSGRYVALGISIDELLKTFDYNDIVTVSVNGLELDMPLTQYVTNIDISQLCLYADPTNKFLFGYEGEMVYIASAYEYTALTTGLFRDTPAGSSQFCEFAGEPGVPVTAEIRLKEKNGYSRLVPLSGLQREYTRSSYPELTDEEYANFRMIRTGDIAEGVLYRSSNPIDPGLSRNTYADKACEEHGIKTVLNLADSENEAERYDGFSRSYYSKQNVLYLDMPLGFSDLEFRRKLEAGLRFMADNEGPYLIHCMEGKFRCGFVSALLECFMGAEPDEVEEDFLRTYINYFRPPEEQYPAIKLVIDGFLERQFGVRNLYSADIRTEAEEYIRGLGLTDDEISRLRERLSGTYQDISQSEKSS